MNRYASAFFKSRHIGCKFPPTPAEEEVLRKMAALARKSPSTPEDENKLDELYAQFNRLWREREGRELDEQKLAHLYALFNNPWKERADE
jgi:hypothetical protein